MNPAATLEALARLNGVQLHYDLAGKRVRANPDALRAIIAALGWPAQTDREVAESLRAAREELWTEPISPVTIVWEGKNGTAKIRLRGQSAFMDARCKVTLENGGSRQWIFNPSDHTPLGRAAIAGETFFEFELMLPDLPSGYHSLQVEAGPASFESLLLSAPSQAWCNPGLARSWGLFLPVYAIHSESSWGAGNLTDYSRLAKWAGAQGAAFLGSLPLLAAFVDKAHCECSPYSPASRLFWNEFFVDPTAAPEFSSCRQARKFACSDGFASRVAGFRKTPLVDYGSEMVLRREILELLTATFFAGTGSRRDQFEKWLRSRPEARSYAQFRACGEKQRAFWQEWPSRLRGGLLRANDFGRDAARYHLYAQWLAEEQIQALLGETRQAGVRFYLDLPLGAHPGSFDVWRNPDLFALNVAVGAPPDQFFSNGQNWAFPPVHPRRQKEQQYRYLRQVLEFHMRHTGLLRIDHVMSLHRLFCIPQGADARDGVYLGYPAEELYALLSLESHRNKTVIVGENLGTVPLEVNEAMRRHNVRQMYVLQFNARPGPEPLSNPHRHSMASLGTHDIATFAGFYRGADIACRESLGLIDRNAAERDYSKRRRLIEAVGSFLKRGSPKREKAGPGFGPRLTTAAALRACLRFLARSSADMLLLDLEDLWLEKDPQNVPGTTRQRANWRRKARLSIEQIAASPRIRNILREIAEARKARASQPVNKEKP